MKHTFDWECNLIVFPQNKPKENPDALDLEVFGRWQTEVYIPPPAVDVSTVLNLNPCHAMLIQEYFLWSFSSSHSFKKAVVSFWQKNVHKYCITA